MSLASEPIFQWMAQYAYQPGIVYSALVAMMLMSAFGLPIPEEVTLISVGILAFMGGNPDLFPPPFPGAPVIDAYEAAGFAFIAVYMSDFLIYGIGWKWGRRLVYSKKLSGIFKPTLMAKVEDWTQRYGAYACGIFRFTPGIRFPGHLACGMLRFPVWKFALIDGVAALISVPTQVLLLAHYGEPILKQIRKFKMALLVIGATALVLFIIYKLRQKWLQRQATLALVQSPSDSSK